MCKLTIKLENKTITGYKLAIQDIKTGKYYSGISGIQYCKGKVKSIKRVPSKRIHLDNTWNINIEAIRNGNLDVYFYNELMYDKTSVFVNKNSAIDSYNMRIDNYVTNMKSLKSKGYKLVLLKMILSKDLYSGRLDYHTNIYAGNYIESIKRIKL